MTDSRGRRVLVWDVDDVLNDLMRSWLADWWLPRHPSCRLAYEDLHENPPHRILGVSEDQYLASLDEFRVGHFAALTPRPSVLTWFTTHADKAEHIALTGVPESCAGLSAAWVLRHYGRWIRTFAFVPSPRGVDRAKPHPTKRGYLERFGLADVVIDDRDSYVRDAASLGLRVVTMPQPWNTSAGRLLSDALDDITTTLGPQ